MAHRSSGGAGCSTNPTHIRFHDLCHSAAPLGRYPDAGPRVPARVVMDVLDHADMSMVTTYQHVLPDLQREAGGRMEAFLEDRP